jgi:hypothetical protein
MPPEASKPLDLTAPQTECLQTQIGTQCKDSQGKALEDEALDELQQMMRPTVDGKEAPPVKATDVRAPRRPLALARALVNILQDWHDAEVLIVGALLAWQAQAGLQQQTACVCNVWRSIGGTRNPRCRHASFTLFQTLVMAECQLAAFCARDCAHAPRVAHAEI